MGSTKERSASTVVVDLDGTLIKTDMLFESLMLLLKRRPWDLWKVVPWALKGKAFLKRKLADLVQPDVSLVPLNQGVVTWLEKRKTEGASLVLATASDQRIANAIGERLGLFDQVLGTETVNLSSRNKAQRLTSLYGEKAFEYVGNSKADFAVWDHASLCHVANASGGILRRLKKSYTLGETFEDRPPLWKTLFKGLRLHQWVKNLLIFVPLLSSHQVTDLPQLGIGVLAFLCFGACASSVYLLNDLLDLDNDRKHPTKQRRPLASGNLAIVAAVPLIPLLLLAAFTTSLLLLPTAFTISLGVYYVVTLAYSSFFKSIALMDVVILSFLYTLRVLSGTAVFGLNPTFWLLTFCVFLFLSLAIVKRYTELRHSKASGSSNKLPGRGYTTQDYELLASFGTSAGYLAVLVFSLYINDPATQSLYQAPKLLWLVSPLLLFWISRVWLVAHRGRMDDDPILFAIKDRVSQIVGFVFLMIFVGANFVPLF